jgi:hypothetical protein
MKVNSFKLYLKEDSGDIVFAFGRFNPPTIGHEKLMDAIKKLARGSQYRIYPTQSQDPKKNPLDFKLKVKFLRKMFPKHARNIMADKGIRTPFDVIVKLYDQGFTRVTMVAGSDRVLEFEKLLNKYNGVKGRHGFYQFENGIIVKSAGERDPDAEGAEGMSASKLRAAANDNDLKTFAKGMPKAFKEVEDLFNAVRAGMGLSESKNFRKHVQLEKVSDRREEYIEGNLFKAGDEVVIKETDEVGTIKVLGTNYVIVQLGENKKRVWLDGVEKLDAVDEAYDKMNAKQKAAHDKPRPNAPESKHTKNFKKKFGEMKSFKQSIEEADAKAALKKKADKSGMPYAILKKVFDRGYAAWKTSHRPGTNPTQWGLARVNSFATKSKGTWGGADKDLAAKV